MIAALVAIIQSATPLVYVALAGVLAQRAGIWNLGLEGLLVAGACSAVLTVRQTGSVLLGVLAAIGVCVLGSALLWFAIERLRANPIIAGLGLTGLGLGGTDLALQAIDGNEAAVQVAVGLPRLGSAAGELAGVSVLVLALPVVIAVIWILLRRTRFGLRLAACGEHPFAARSVGVDPQRMRLIALCSGGVLCALGGTELALGSLNTFSVGMSAGRGFMAFAAVIFGASDAAGASAAALFFGLVEYLGIRAQLALGNAIPRELVQSLPYVATVAGVWLSSRLRGGSVSGLGELRDYG